MHKSLYDDIIVEVCCGYNWSGRTKCMSLLAPMAHADIIFPGARLFGFGEGSGERQRKELSDIYLVFHFSCSVGWAVLTMSYYNLFTRLCPNCVLLLGREGRSLLGAFAKLGPEASVCLQLLSIRETVLKNAIKRVFTLMIAFFFFS